MPLAGQTGDRWCRRTRGRTTHEVLRWVGGLHTVTNWRSSRHYHVATITRPEVRERSSGPVVGARLSTMAILTTDPPSCNAKFGEGKERGFVNVPRLATRNRRHWKGGRALIERI